MQRSPTERCPLRGGARQPLARRIRVPAMAPGQVARASAVIAVAAAALATLAVFAAAGAGLAGACPNAAAACAADAGCSAFGVHGGGYQLHGCATAGALVPNDDWTIWVPAGPGPKSAKPSAWKALGESAASHPSAHARTPRRLRARTRAFVCAASPPSTPPRVSPLPALSSPSLCLS